MTPDERNAIAGEVGQTLFDLQRQQSQEPTKEVARRLRCTAVETVAKRHGLSVAAVSAAFDAFGGDGIHLPAPKRPRGRPRAYLDHKVIQAAAVARVLQDDYHWAYREAMEAVLIIFGVHHGKIDSYRRAATKPRHPSAGVLQPANIEDARMPQPASIDATRIEAAWALHERCTMRGTPARKLREAIAQVNAKGRAFPLDSILSAKQPAD